MMDNTTLRERNVIKFHYGWDSNKCMNLVEVGEIFGISPERARQIRNHAFRKIRASKCGRLKARKLYIQKAHKSFYSADDVVKNICFVERYLSGVI